MAETVFLHVGAPKCGTTFVQSVLWGNRDALAEQGILVPGRRPFAHERVSMAIRRGATEPTGQGSPGAVWQRIKAEIARWDGSAILSNEWLSLATADHAAEAIRQLSPARVEIIVSTRNLVALVPAAWQETVKLGRSHGLDDFVLALDSTATGPGGVDRWRWSTLDAALILETWSRDVPAERVHVVTVPPHGAEPDALWSRFAAACGIVPDSVSTDVGRPNESLSSEAAALMQRVAPRLLEAVEASPPHHWTQPYRWVRELVGHQILVPQPGSRIGLRDEQVERLQERSRNVHTALGRAGYRVSGDLDDLLVAPAGEGARHPDDVTSDEISELAITLATELFTRLRDETNRDAEDAAP